MNVTAISIINLAQMLLLILRKYINGNRNEKLSKRYVITHFIMLGILISIAMVNLTIDGDREYATIVWLLEAILLIVILSVIIDDNYFKLKDKQRNKKDILNNIIIFLVLIFGIIVVGFGVQTSGYTHYDNIDGNQGEVKLYIDMQQNKIDGTEAISLSTVKSTFGFGKKYVYIKTNDSEAIKELQKLDKKNFIKVDADVTGRFIGYTNTKINNTNKAIPVIEVNKIGIRIIKEN